MIYDVNIFKVSATGLQHLESYIKQNISGKLSEN